MSLGHKLLGGLRFVARLFVPLGGIARNRSALSVVLWVVHFVLVGFVLWGLYYLNNSVLHYDRMLPGHSLFVRKGWMSILFVLVYVQGWFGYWLWKLIVEPDVSDFPEIETAWASTVDELQKNGIDLETAPVYLVLGRPEQSMDALFDSTGQRYLVRPSATNSAPVQVYATETEIFVTLAGCSLTGTYCSQLFGGVGDWIADPTSDQSEILDTIRAHGDSVSADDSRANVERIHQILRQAELDRREVTNDERQRMRRMVRRDSTSPSCIRNEGERTRSLSRLAAFCALLVRDRWPTCPVDGMLLVLPLAITESDQMPIELGQALQKDLTVLRGGLQVNCPVVTMVSDIDTLPGAGEFLEQFEQKQLDRRVGQRCPMVPLLEAQPGRTGLYENRAQMLGSLAHWVGTAVPAGWVYRSFRLDDPERGDDREAVRRLNSQLFLFMHEMRNRQAKIARVLVHALSEDHEEPYFFCGCYLAATGSESKRARGFVKGVFQRLAEERKHKTWTNTAIDEELQLHRYADIARIVLGVLVFSTLALFGYRLFG